MIKEGKIGVQEAVCLTTITITAKVFFTSPAFLTNFVGTAGWQMTIISNITAIAAFSIIFLLLKRFPGKNIIEIFNLSLGPFIGFLFSFVFSAAFIESAAVILREFVDVIKVYVYPETPSEIIVGIVTITVFIASFLGLETIARVSKLTAYIMLVSYIMLLILAAQKYKLTNLFPILGYGIDKTMLHGLRRSSAYEEVLILTVFAGSLQGLKHIRKAGYIALILSGTLVTSGLLCFSLAFPFQITQEVTAPIYELAREIKYGTFFQRLDPIFLFLWIYASMITILALFYCSISCYCKTFKLNDKRPVLIPMSVILFTIAMLPRDFSSVIEGQVQRAREYGWTIYYVLPFIAFIAAILRRKKGVSKNA